MFHALFRIYKEEGILALYSGIAPALLRQASYGTIKIGIYQSLKRLFVDRLEDETLLINMICGVVSGVISSTIANPTDVLKIRMQAQGSLFQGGMIGSFIDIYQQEGTRGLWRGVVPTAQRAAIVVGVELPVYDITKKHLILSGLLGDTIFTHFVSSFSCGLAGALASNPVDVVRTRMMNQRAIVGNVELYKGTLDGLLKTWKTEGFFALYKGFWPNWLRLGPWNIISNMCVYVDTYIYAHILDIFCFDTADVSQLTLPALSPRYFLLKQVSNPYDIVIAICSTNDFSHHLC
ncbi:brain mitochondrial carrier protein 1 isoform X2 [Monodelphis domestica]|nr:brain mitochondrial carrier protein 1 isoform X2 [Monodelphis domestica]